MNSANLYWIPSDTPDTTNTIFPLSLEAASSKILLKSEVTSEASLKRKTAFFFYPKIGSMKSSENSMRVGIEEA